ncbi:MULTISPECIES: hypothetical protein [unclassified Nocardia]
MPEPREPSETKEEMTWDTDSFINDESNPPLVQSVNYDTGTSERRDRR